MRKPHFLVGLGLLLPLAALAWWQGWFATEPVYHGRTVTQWLDAMALYDDVREWDRTPRVTFEAPQSPEAVAADPALHALLALGPKTLPALKAHLMEPPQPYPWWDQLRYRLGTVWMRFQDPNYPPFTSLPLQYTSHDDARSLSAALTLLALGTNRDGGMPVLMEDYIRESSSTNRTRRLFPNYRAIETAMAGLPQARQEIQDTIDGWLTHPNPLYRQFAAKNALAKSFPTEFPRWRPLLMRMVASDQEDPEVRQGAMFALLHRSETEDPEFTGLCGQLLTNNASGSLLRARAAAGIRFSGSATNNFLSQLRAATNDPDIYVQNSARSELGHFRMLQQYPKKVHALTNANLPNAPSTKAP